MIGYKTEIVRAPRNWATSVIDSILRKMSGSPEIKKRVPLGDDLELRLYTLPIDPLHEGIIINAARGITMATGYLGDFDIDIKTP